MRDEITRRRMIIRTALGLYGLALATTFGLNPPKATDLEATVSLPTAGAECDTDELQISTESLESFLPKIEPEKMGDAFIKEYSDIKLANGTRLFSDRKIREQFRYQERICKYFGRARSEGLMHRNDGRKKALFIIATDDPNGAFTYGGSWYAEGFYKLMSRAYDVRIVFAHEISRVNDALKNAENADGPVFIFGHGASGENYGTAICLGADPDNLNSEEDKNRFTINRTNIGELTGLRNLRNELYILSCGAGFGEDSIAERIAEFSGKTVYAPAGLSDPYQRGRTEDARIHDLWPVGKKADPYKLESVKINNGRFRVFDGVE